MKVYANKKTKRFHSTRRNDACRAREIKPSNLLRFDSVEEAKDAGYKPCGVCCRESE